MERRENKHQYKTAKASPNPLHRIDRIQTLVMKDQSQSTISKHETSPAAMSLTIGGTPSLSQSQNDNSSILATSPSSSSSSLNEKFTIPKQGRKHHHYYSPSKINEGHRALCSDRKGFLNGFKPKSFVLSVS